MFTQMVSILYAANYLKPPKEGSSLLDRMYRVSYNGAL